MDSSQANTPDLTLEYSPPHFSYDVHTDSSESPGPSTYEPFANYVGFPDSPPLGPFGALALGISLVSTTNPNSVAASHLYPQSHPRPGSLSFASTSSSSAALSETHGLSISPLLTLSPPHAHSASAGHHPSPSSDRDSMEHDQHPSPTTASQADVHDGAGSSTNSPTSSTSTSRRYPRGDRYNPMAPYQGSPRSTRSTRTAPRRSGGAPRKNPRRQELDMSDEEGDAMGDEPLDTKVSTFDVQHPARSEETRRQRIESEQRRRDELRDGYARLKNALPSSNQKSSKVHLLDRAVTYIRQLEMSQQSLQTRLNNTENDLARQRGVNEGLIRTITDPTRLPPAATNTSASASATSSNTASTPPGLAESTNKKES